MRPLVVDGTQRNGPGLDGTEVPRPAHGGMHGNGAYSGKYAPFRVSGTRSETRYSRRRRMRSVVGVINPMSTMKPLNRMSSNPRFRSDDPGVEPSSVSVGGRVTRGVAVALRT